MIGSYRRLVASILMSLFLLVVPLPRAAVAEDTSSATPQLDASLQTAVEADWAAQEHRNGRQCNSPEAIRDAYRRASRLLADLAHLPGTPELSAERALLEHAATDLNRLDVLDEASRLKLYRQLRWLTRTAALKNPLLTGRPLVFMKRHRFVSQMLHEYLGYYYDYGDIAGGGVYLLQQPGHSLQVRDLIDGRLPRGNYTTLAVSQDARTLYFAFAERAPQKPDYYSAQRRSFHIFAMDADGVQLRQLTEGIDDDFDPCPLPDGELVFMSTRRGGFGRCHNPWEPLPTYTLHRMDGSGGNIRTLSFHETNEWHPTVLADGRIVYSRWDYVDRSAANFHGLWTSHPDGTDPSVLFGNYTHRINACFQPRSIPGSQQIAFIAGAHHADVGGSLVLLDPSRVSLDRVTGEDQLDATETLTPEVCFPEAGLAPELLSQPVASVGGLFPRGVQFRSVAGHGSGSQTRHRDGTVLFRPFRQLGAVVPRGGHFLHVSHSPGLSSESADRLQFDRFGVGGRSRIGAAGRTAEPDAVAV